MIEVKNVSYSYGNKPVLRNVSFTLGHGKCMGILGNNGSGKTTLLTCLNKIRTPRSGKVYVDKKDISKMSLAETARHISYVAQKNEVCQMTVFDTVLLGRKPYIKWSISQEDIDICEAALELVGMSGFKLRYVHELSGGEQQKVMLARALAQQPKVLLLDEPTSNLDPRNQYEMMALVRDLASGRGISVIVVLHDVSLALRYCDQFLFMKAGSVYAFGGPSIVNEETIYDVYGVDSTIAEVNGRKVVVVN